MQQPGVRHLFRAKSPATIARLRAANGKQRKSISDNLSIASISRLERGLNVAWKTAEAYRLAVAPNLAFDEMFELCPERETSTNFTWEQVSRAATKVGRKVFRKFKPDFLITFAGPSSLFTSLVMTKALSREEFLKTSIHLAIFRDKRRSITTVERRGFKIVDSHRFNLRIPIAVSRVKNRANVRVAVIDDTVTTGSSLEKMIQYLIRCGFRRKNVLYATCVCSKEALREPNTRPDVWVYKTAGSYRLPWGPPL